MYKLVEYCEIAHTTNYEPQVALMKTLVYCCQAVKLGKDTNIPYDYASILEESRHRYAKAGLTGVLTYNDGYFMHCLEGNEEELDRAMKRTLRDPKFNHFEVLMSERTPFRMFDKWRMASPKVLQTDARFSAFVAQYKTAFKELFDYHKELLLRNLCKNQVEAIGLPNFQQ